jgi:hypothetical protein
VRVYTRVGKNVRVSNGWFIGTALLLLSFAWLLLKVLALGLLFVVALLGAAYLTIADRDESHGKSFGENVAGLWRGLTEPFRR